MQVASARPGFAWVEGRGQRLEVNTALVGEVQAGDWLLVFLGSAREHIDAVRAAEVGAMLDLLETAMQGQGGDAPPFELPSQMSAEQLAALAG